MSSRAQEYADEQRKKALNILGGTCVYCGEKEVVVLCIDHIKPVGKSRKVTLQVAREIIKDPPIAKKKYQILCRNCNWRKMIQNGEHNIKNAGLAYAYQWQIKRLQKEVNSIKKRINQVVGKVYKDNENPNKSELKPAQVLAEKAYQLRGEFVNYSGRINVSKLRITLIKSEGIHIGNTKGYEVKEWLLNLHPKEFRR